MGVSKFSRNTIFKNKIFVSIYPNIDYIAKIII
jgi:hypothetical protein